MQIRRDRVRPNLFTRKDYSKKGKTASKFDETPIRERASAKGEDMGGRFAKRPWTRRLPPRPTPAAQSY
ncbi:Hypothetical protein NTJ_03187 [Nesidiocoris tenuis]|uniref:Uncharacterized protein n=1 Tax=Nesidiocoris tenuis TaxID=355587 RepID=A0ABN7AEB9_9HEMI|nr:Hypothetical protein NTJ_03187 [Nesidiocoris tenuis]